MVRGRYPAKIKPKLPSYLRGVKLGCGWFEDHIVGILNFNKTLENIAKLSRDDLDCIKKCLDVIGEEKMVSCEKVRTSDRTAEEEKFIEDRKEYQVGTVGMGVDNVNHPPHYNNSPAHCTCGRRIECIDITRHYPFNVGNAIKYLWRADLKGAPIEDLRKAIWYINDEISKREQSK